jgi:hypothetical protein
VWALHMTGNAIMSSLSRGCKPLCDQIVLWYYANASSFERVALCAGFDSLPV